MGTKNSKMMGSSNPPLRRRDASNTRWNTENTTGHLMVFGADDPSTASDWDPSKGSTPWANTAIGEADCKAYAKEGVLVPVEGTLNSTTLVWNDAQKVCQSAYSYSSGCGSGDYPVNFNGAYLTCVPLSKAQQERGSYAAQVAASGTSTIPGTVQGSPTPVPAPDTRPSDWSGDASGGLTKDECDFYENSGAKVVVEGTSACTTLKWNAASGICQTVRSLEGCGSKQGAGYPVNFNGLYVDCVPLDKAKDERSYYKKVRVPLACGGGSVSPVAPASSVPPVISPTGCPGGNNCPPPSASGPSGPSGASGASGPCTGAGCPPDDTPKPSSKIEAWFKDKKNLPIIIGGSVGTVILLIIIFMLLSGGGSSSSKKSSSTTTTPPA